MRISHLQRLSLIHIYLNTLPEADIQAMADTYTEGYRIGFETTGKDLSKKTAAQVRYPIGFERMVRAAVCNFEMCIRDREHSGNTYFRSDWSERANFLHLHSGTMGAGHGHSDKLHIDLVVNGEDVLMDGGRYTYCLLYTSSCTRWRIHQRSGLTVLPRCSGRRGLSAARCSRRIRPGSNVSYHWKTGQ